MSLNSEPIKETNDLLRMIDAGIAALRKDDSEEVLTVDPEQVLPKANAAK